MKLHRLFGVSAAVACAAVLAIAGQVVAANPVVVNGDFETDAAAFVTWPGYVANGANPAQITGWTGDGGRGVNPVSDGNAPFRDNGGNNTHVAFLQGTSYIEQTVSGFTVGGDYVLSLEFNARNCCGDFPIGVISLNGIEAASSADLFPPPGAIVPVGGTNAWYAADIEFTAPTSDITVRIATSPAAGGDSTMLVDNVSFALVPEPSTGLMFVLGMLGLVGHRRRNRR